MPARRYDGKSHSAEAYNFSVGKGFVNFEIRNIHSAEYAPVFRAEREVQPEEPAEESAAAPAAEDAAPSKIVTISQPADDGSVIVMIGQPVERNCGACFPLETGTVVGFVDVPDGVVLRGGVFALVRWDYNPDRPERVRLSDIHRRGWRSANGSPLGVFVC